MREWSDLFLAECLTIGLGGWIVTCEGSREVLVLCVVKCVYYEKVFVLIFVICLREVICVGAL